MASMRRIAELNPARPLYIVTHKYNRVGDQIWSKDQRGVVHEYEYDALGRITVDKVTDFPAGVDDTIKAILYAYDAKGRQTDIISSDAQYPIVDHYNHLLYEYLPDGRLSRIWQSYHDPVETSGGSPSAYAEYIYEDVPFSPVDGSGNVNRLDKLVYPDGHELEYAYGSAAGDVDDSISRITGLSITGPATTLDVASYDYLAGGIVAVTTYEDIGVILDRSAAHDGSRTAGVYPAFDRFGRLIRHMWVDYDFEEHATDPDLPAKPPIVEHSFGYDKVGNRLNRYDARPGAKQTRRHDEFVYDGLNRVTNAHRGERIDTQTFNYHAESQRWMLDTLGNWTVVDHSPDQSGANWTMELREHNDANELGSRDVDGDQNDDFDFDYDDAGNLETVNPLAHAFNYNYTHDAWNRLVEVEYAGTTTSTIAKYEYNGLHWRTVARLDTDGDLSRDELHVYYYDNDWRILEDEQYDYGHSSGYPGTSPTRRTQNVWGLRGTDDLILHRQDNTTDDDFDDAEDRAFWHLTDAQFSTVAVLDEAAKVVERVSYDAFGRARHHHDRDVNGDGAYDYNDYLIVQSLATFTGKPITHADYNVDADLNRDGVINAGDLSAMTFTYEAALVFGLISGDDVDNVVGYAGYVFDPYLEAYLARHRWYSPELGRWFERDPAGYIDGMSLYLYVGGNPMVMVDPLGLAGGPIDVVGDLCQMWWDSHPVNGIITGFNNGMERAENYAELQGREPTLDERVGGFLEEFTGMGRLGDAFAGYDTVNQRQMTTGERVVNGAIGTVQGVGVVAAGPGIAGTLNAATRTTAAQVDNVATNVLTTATRQADEVTETTARYSRAVQLAENRANGAARNARVQSRLEGKFQGANVQREQLLRNADGSKAIDPVTGTGRRLDHAVIENGRGRATVETTSRTASKESQLAKQRRIMNNGGHFIRDRRTGQLIDISGVPFRVFRIR